MKRSGELVIASKNNAFPWPYFYRLAKPNVIFITLTVLACIYGPFWFLPDQERRPEVFIYLGFLLPTIILAYLVLLYFSLSRSKSLRTIWGQVSEIEKRFTTSDKLKLHYNSDEWKKVEMALFDSEKRLEQKIQQIQDDHEKNLIILESISDAIIATDMYHNALFFNNRFKNLFSAQNFSEENIKLWKLINHPEIIDAFNHCLKTTNTTKLKAIEIKIDEKLTFFNLTISPLKNNSHQIIGAIAIFHDITETKLSEKMRVDFIANISHEIKTPITSIKGFAQMLSGQKNKIPEDFHLFIDKILNNTERLLSLFNDLLNLSVVDSTKKIELMPISIHDLCHSIFLNIQTNYPNKKVSIQYNLKHDSILADEKLIYQAFTNIIDNACKYNHENPIIKIESAVEAEGLLIKISDNGFGIPQDQLNRIFERFYRVDSSRNNNEIPGTGIGLSLVKNIILKHSGKVWAESSNNLGTTFNIIIPKNLIN